MGDLLLRRRSMMAQDSVPLGYTRLSYLESDGAQRINTGITGDRQLDISLTFMTLSFDLYGPIFGNYTSEQDSGYRIIYGGNNNRLLYNISSLFGGQTSAYSHNEPIVNVIHNVELLYDGHRFLFDGVESTNEMVQSTGNNSRIALYNNRISTYGGIRMRVYKWKMKENGVLIQNFIPAIRNSDQEYGMWDTVTKTFFINIGTGAFTGQ